MNRALDPEGEELKLAYLEKREYLQGTTLFDGVRDFVPQGIRGSFKVGEILRTDRVFISPVSRAHFNELEPTRHHAELQWHSADRNGAIYVWALPPSRAPLRLPYDEREITDDAVVNDRILTQARTSSYGFVPTIVSLNKYLLLRAIPKAQGQWLFARLDFANLPVYWKELRLEASAVLAGGRLVRSEVGVDGMYCGQLFFSWLQADEKLIPKIA